MDPESGALAFIAILAYLLPTLIVLLRVPHRHLGPVIVVNLLTGWTVIGWIVALALAASPAEMVTWRSPRAVPPSWTNTAPPSWSQPQPQPPRRAPPVSPRRQVPPPSSRSGRQVPPPPAPPRPAP